MTKEEETQLRKDTKQRLAHINLEDAKMGHSVRRANNRSEGWKATHQSVVPSVFKKYL